MSTCKLTDRVVKGAKPREQPYTLWDGNGLHVLIKSNGKKYWRLQYRFDNRKRLISLGQYPAITLEKARLLTAEARRCVANHEDPVYIKKQHRRENTWSRDSRFKTIAQAWFEHWGTNKSPVTSKAAWRRLEIHVFPVIGNKDIRSLKEDDFVELLIAIDSCKHAGEVSWRIYQLCKQIVSYAQGPLCRLIKINAFDSFKAKEILKPRTSGHHARIGVTQLPDLLLSIKNYPDPVVRSSVKILMMTFVRTMELLDASWGEIDWNFKQWRIPPERTKMRVEHIVPLSAQVLSELEILKKLADGDEKWKKNWRESQRIFPWQGEGRRNVILNAIYDMGYKGKMTGHGFRALATTLLHELGYKHQHIELQLGHSEKDAYNDADYIQSRPVMMQGWADYLSGEING
jgi:integrase